MPQWKTCTASNPHNGGHLSLPDGRSIMILLIFHWHRDMWYLPEWMESTPRALPFSLREPKHVITLSTKVYNVERNQSCRCCEMV